MNSPFIIQKKGKYNLSEYGQQVFLYPYARYAFYELLQKTNITSIYIPSFICRDMLAPIKSLKVNYSFYEVDNELNPKLEDIQCDSILMINYFGFEQNINPFNKYREKFGAIIIEDNAHGFYSKDSKGNLLGTRGDIGLLSIRKTVFLPNGAALLINNSKFINIHYQNANVNYTEEDTKYEKKLNLKKIIFTKFLGIFFLLFRRYFRYIKTGSLLPLPDSNSEIIMPENKFLTPLIRDKCIPINMEYERQRRRNMYFDIERYSKEYSIEPVYTLGDNSVPFEFAFIDNGNVQEFEIFLLKKGYFILPWPDLPSEVIDSCPKFYKNIKVVPFLW